MYVAAFVTDKPDAEPARAETREAFLEYLRSHPAHPGVVVHHGGPTLADDGESIVGRVLLLEAPSVEAARAFLADSPFGKANVFAECHVHAWDWTTGRPG